VKNDEVIEQQTGEDHPKTSDDEKLPGTGNDEKPPEIGDDEKLPETGNDEKSDPDCTDCDPTEEGETSTVVRGKWYFLFLI
jgi:hypothetical protein